MMKWIHLFGLPCTTTGWFIIIFANKFTFSKNESKSFHMNQKASIKFKVLDNVSTFEHV